MAIFMLITSRSQVINWFRRALVVIDVHARDVVTALVAKGVSSLDDFDWTKQLRYYWDAEADNCIVRQTNTRFVYGYEYLGNTER